ncbi:type II secretion system protein [Candidatus Curtissbacteria bacterium]|nr:type II secretion system protein [Candidatus Curtissbacteria bacterium]
MRQNRKIESGQSLIEVVVALGVVTALAVSLVATTLFVQRASEGARNNTQATKLVQQNIEQIRIFRDRNASGFDALPASGCYTLNTTNPNPAAWTLAGLSACSPIPPAGSEAIILNNTTFSRWFSFASDSSTKKTVVVTVSWTDSGGVQQVVNWTFLSKPCSGQIGEGGGASPCP